ncbi:MAG: efflux RND transporter permease subunit [Gammaproteobacteria bacterium]
MKFTDLFIQRPVLSIVISLIIFLVGLRAFVDLPVRQYPLIQPAVINVTTLFPGASADLMEGFVSTPIESALASAEGVDFITSTNTVGRSVVTAYFKLGRDINKALTDTSNLVTSTREILPKEVRPSIITKDDPNAHPIIYMSFSSKSMPEVEVGDYLTRIIKPQLATLPGVGKVDVYVAPYAMRLWLDPRRMSARGITADNIAASLIANNAQSAAGRISGQWQEFDVNAVTDLRTAEQFDNLILKKKDDYLIRLKDVGHAELSSEEQRSALFLKGVPAVVLAITPQSTGNPVEIAKHVKALMPHIQEGLPGDLKADIIWDGSTFVSESIKEVYKTILEATIFVVIVIFLFLGSVRSVIIPIVTIPLSLIGVCTVMLVLGYTLNSMTLLAAVLAIGLVVDDAIVVLENIHRHLEEGLSGVEAALKGAREIGFAVIAMTITLAAVYAPVGFMTGLTGSLFREFAFTLAASVVISGIIALTLTPMMCAKLLRHEKRKGFSQRIDAQFNKLMHVYRHGLTRLLDNKKRVIMVAAVVYLSCYVLYSSLSSELAPQEDEGWIMAIAEAPTSANLAYTRKYTHLIDKMLENIPDMDNYLTIDGYPNGVNTAMAIIVLKPWGERKFSLKQILETLMPQLMGITGIQAFAFNAASLPGANSDEPIGFVLKTMGSYEELNKIMEKFQAAVAKNPKFFNMKSDLKLDKAQIQIDIDRSKASEMGISTSAIGNTLGLLLGEPTVTRFVMNGRSYSVIPQLQVDFRRNPTELEQINIRTETGELVPLANIVHLKEMSGAKNLNHFQQQRAARFSAFLAPGYSVGEALAYLKKTAKEVLPDTVDYDFSGQSRQFIQASGAMAMTFGFAVIFIFLVLAAQFESFRDPLIVMLSVPLAISGGLLLILITGGTINIYTQIGLVTLIGLITKHGILIVEFANQLREQGVEIKQAIIDAASLRLRPILMTTGAMVLGVFPLAIASGAGAAARSQIGWTLIGGLMFGTLLTLFVIPVAYMLLSKKDHSVLPT